MAIFDLQLLQFSVIEPDRVAVLLLPLFGDFFLRDHHGVGSFFIALMTFLSFKQIVLKVSDLDVTLIIELIYTAVEDNFQPVKFRNRAFFFISQLVDKLSQTGIVVEIALILTPV